MQPSRHLPGRLFFCMDEGDVRGNEKEEGASQSPCQKGEKPAHPKKQLLFTGKESIMKVKLQPSVAQRFLFQAAWEMGRPWREPSDSCSDFDLFAEGERPSEEC